MGAPSGSKNCSVLTDAHDLRNLREFEKGAVDDTHIRSDSFSSEPQAWREEKMLRASELREFRQAKIATDRPRKLLPKNSQEGPQLGSKRALPTFMKLRSKESNAGDEPADKRPRAGDESPQGAGSDASPADASAPAASPATKSLGAGLSGYASDSDEEESGEEAH